jgi:hypothetical protein
MQTFKYILPFVNILVKCIKSFRKNKGVLCYQVCNTDMGSGF